MILVTGATGTVGSEVVRQLIERGTKFRVLVHHPKDADWMSDPIVEVYRGDYGEPESLDKAMIGIDHLFILCPPGPNLLQWERNLTDSAVRMGVTHIVKQSVYAASAFSPVGLVQRHWKSERYIEEAGLPFTHIRPNYFMQNLLSSAGMIAGEGKIYNPVGSGHVAMIDVRDVATVAVQSLTTVGHVARIYEITGPEALTYSQIADRLSSVLGRRVEVVDISPATLRDTMIQRGVPSSIADDSEGLAELYSQDAGSTVTGWVDRLTGGPPVSFDDFAGDYADDFLAAARKAA